MRGIACIGRQARYTSGAWRNRPVSHARASALQSPAPHLFLSHRLPRPNRDGMHITVSCGAAALGCATLFSHFRRPRAAGPHVLRPYCYASGRGDCGRKLRAGIPGATMSREAPKKPNPGPLSRFRGAGFSCAFRRSTTRDGPFQVDCRRVFWLPGHPSAAPSHRCDAPLRQWLVQRLSPVTAARPRPVFTAFPHCPRSLASGRPATNQL